MKRLLSIAALCLSLAACGGDSGGDSSPSSNTPDNSNSGARLDLNPPTALTLDTPPTTGKLPADLLPPA